jgi:ethanolamine utilization protein EutP (predicted NTPase)
MMCCAVNGQGAGVAAAISIQMKVDVADVDIKKVQKTLLQQGARIH